MGRPHERVGLHWLTAALLHVRACPCSGTVHWVRGQRGVWDGAGRWSPIVQPWVLLLLALLLVCLALPLLPLQGLLRMLMRAVLLLLMLVQALLLTSWVGLWQVVEQKRQQQQQHYQQQVLGLLRMMQGKQGR